MLSWMGQERASGAQPGQTRVMGVIVVRTRSPSRWDQTGKSGQFYGSGQGLEAEGWPWCFVPVCGLFRTETSLSIFVGPEQKGLLLEFCALWTLKLLLEYQLFPDCLLSRPENEQLLCVWRQSTNAAVSVLMRFWPSSPPHDYCSGSSYRLLLLEPPNWLPLSSQGDFLKCKSKSEHFIPLHRVLWRLLVSHLMSFPC